MIDFIKISKVINPKDLMTDNLHFISEGRGWARFMLRLKGSIEVRFNYHTSILTIKGSLPYFLQGHNLFSSQNGAKQAIKIIEGLIGIPLHDACVEEFEYGVVVRPNFSPQLIFLSHSGIDGFRKDTYTKNKDVVTGVVYKKKGVKIKMYDPWANINSCSNKVSSETRKELKAHGLHRGDNSIKLEFHHSKPEELTEENELTVEEMLSCWFIHVCQCFLLGNYEQINKTELVALPKTKKAASTSMILLLALISECNCIEERTNQIMIALSDVLSPQDRSARRRVIKASLKKLSSEKCLYSIEEQLINALKC